MPNYGTVVLGGHNLEKKKKKEKSAHQTVTKQ